MKKIILVLVFLLKIQFNFSQSIQLTENAEVSIITVGPGKVLYEKFGHSAIRIKDKSLNIDQVYNYGMFDFNAPNFYSNFTKGRLIYKLASYPFHYFVKSNNKDKRWIKEQVLNLSQEDNQAFFTFLNNNAKPKNANYEYDPFFENCATKMPDIVQQILNNKVSFTEDFVIKNQSLRQLMNNEIHWNTWGSLGINVALGSKLDKIATAKEYMYLPDFVFKSFKNAEYFDKNQPKQLISKENTILNFEEITPAADAISPLLVINIFMLIGLFVTYKDVKNNTRTKWFDFSLFFITGIVGSLVVFLWFFTNHSTTPNNFNFLWAFAPNLIIAFYLLKNNPPKWIRKYVFLLLVLLFIIPIIWIAKIQLFALSLLPVFILFGVRYFFLQKNLLTFHK
ncbi:MULTISPECIES: lipoprotein N-acyltransferase Lnb domain-containing protein [Tenacibaculum]|uniref:lipoprotein N-acyltransferase Lnb domain-containing protein n=1 Tax=Tenacibaculum TaxID=104267 RepID=UPI001F0A3F4B|nr:MULTISPECIES: DUF4105 domain-containing protein [Tenacibaculum]MCH3881960.1 DUF4105 domain-containing protein [Tenacibaculum aquimarinum]MDO6600713.1 DUF4105 domain-containing protein [Tenacibaculum sp. 1_MG-2023]